MKQHEFYFTIPVMKKVNNQYTHIGDWNISGLAENAENYDIYMCNFLRKEMLDIQIGIEDITKRDEDFLSAIQAHLEWKFEKPTQDDLADFSEEERDIKEHEMITE